jgi:hypothetical protein
MAPRHMGEYIVDLQTWGRAMPCLLKVSLDFFSSLFSL